MRQPLLGPHQLSRDGFTFGPGAVRAAAGAIAGESAGPTVVPAVGNITEGIVKYGAAIDAATIDGIATDLEFAFTFYSIYQLAR